MTPSPVISPPQMKREALSSWTIVPSFSARPTAIRHSEALNLCLTLARQIFLSLAYPPKGASREKLLILESFMLEEADFIGLK